MSFRALWQTLHDPTRLRILALLEKEELSVAEIAGNSCTSANREFPPT